MTSDRRREMMKMSCERGGRSDAADFSRPSVNQSVSQSVCCTCAALLRIFHGRSPLDPLSAHLSSSHFQCVSSPVPRARLSLSLTQMHAKFARTEAAFSMSLETCVFYSNSPFVCFSSFVFFFGVLSQTCFWRW
jgi:hypothetical protein